MIHNPALAPVDRSMLAPASIAAALDYAESLDLRDEIGSEVTKEDRRLIATVVVRNGSRDIYEAFQESDPPRRSIVDDREALRVALLKHARHKVRCLAARWLDSGGTALSIDDAVMLARSTRFLLDQRPRRPVDPVLGVFGRTLLREPGSDTREGRLDWVRCIARRKNRFLFLADAFWRAVMAAQEKDEPICVAIALMLGTGCRIEDLTGQIAIRAEARELTVAFPRWSAATHPRSGRVSQIEPRTSSSGWLYEHVIINGPPIWRSWRSREQGDRPECHTLFGCDGAGGYPDRPKLLNEIARAGRVTVPEFPFDFTPELLRHVSRSPEEVRVEKSYRPLRDT
ncbi:hypothetical protein [Histidinibacterium lentulum]|uniref:Uncharacterized protein n=1 Tax=Histidinibacterium lentulum TaxID=2480588 RepID=A0A3N2QS74_9RHOB|nr:hypothetical protein [Histidinibacterium lentulum]ROT98071.1 hypothetical protein EAT49_17530 [Histidinibacterium lentulum]